MIEDQWRSIPATDFARELTNLLDNPERIWKRPYERSISRYSQCLLANMITAGAPILYDDLQRLMQSFAGRFSGKYGITHNDFEFRKSIRELDGSFLVTKKPSAANEIVVSFYDPSVEDLLINHLAQNFGLVRDILETAIFFNQFLSIFSMDGPGTGLGISVTGRVDLGSELTELALDRVIGDYNNLDTSVLQSYAYSPFKEYGPLDRLWELVEATRHLSDSRLGLFILEHFESLRDLELDLFDESFTRLADIAIWLGPQRLPDPGRLIAHFLNQTNSLFQFNELERLAEVFPNILHALIALKKDEFDSKVRAVIDEEIQMRSENEMDEVLEEVERISSVYNINLDEVEQDLQQRVADAKD